MIIALFPRPSGLIFDITVAFLVDEMQLPSIQTIESWPTANYVDPVRRGPANIITNLLFFLLALLIVCIRIYTRVRISRSFGWDDGLILAAMVLSTIFRALHKLTTAGSNDGIRHPRNRGGEAVRLGQAHMGCS